MTTNKFLDDEEYNMDSEDGSDGDDTKTRKTKPTKKSEKHAGYKEESTGIGEVGLVWLRNQTTSMKYIKNQVMYNVKVEHGVMVSDCCRLRLSLDQ